MTKKIKTPLNQFVPIKFSQDKLTSYAGSHFLFQFFKLTNLHIRLTKAFERFDLNYAYKTSDMLILVIVFLILGGERIKHIPYIYNDALIQKLLGWDKYPSVGTIYNRFKKFVNSSVALLIEVNSELVYENIKNLGLDKIELTIDLDGSVISSRGKPEFAHKGYNDKKQGARSYYPLFAHLAETGQIMDMRMRPGNVHDSKQAVDMLRNLFRTTRMKLKHSRLLIRGDSAFFSDKIISYIENRGGKYTIVVPQRFPELNTVIKKAKGWRSHGKFETASFWFSFKGWQKERLFVVSRMKLTEKEKSELDPQLNLFELNSTEYKYQIICTNIVFSDKEVVEIMRGRAGCEQTFAEMQNNFASHNIVSHNYGANKAWLATSVLSYNLYQYFIQQVLKKGKTEAQNNKRTRVVRAIKAITARFTIFTIPGRLCKTNNRQSLNIPEAAASKKRMLSIQERLNEIEKLKLAS